MFSSIGKSAGAMGAVMLALIGLCGGMGYISASNTQRANCRVGQRDDRGPAAHEFRYDA